MTGGFGDKIPAIDLMISRTPMFLQTSPKLK
jgi:hypothetical protein